MFVYPKVNVEHFKYISLSTSINFHGDKIKTLLNLVHLQITTQSGEVCYKVFIVIF